MNMNQPAPETGKDQPLKDDIRLLGRILGDVIRDQDGDAAFDLVEQVRKLSVAFRRHADHDADHDGDRSPGMENACRVTGGVVGFVRHGARNKQSAAGRCPRPTAPSQGPPRAFLR